MTGEDIASLIDPCPSEDALAAYIGGRTSISERDAIDRHLLECSACYEAFTEIGRLFASEASSTCPHEERLVALAEGALSPASLDSVLHHLEGCHECQAVVGASQAEASRDGVGAGDIIGRYEVVRRVGAGAMGIVYEAHDPRLDRSVALKLLNPDRSRNRSARLRLVREAQALARLSHPNVLPVYDFGEWQGTTYIAMEFVEGQTLTEWSVGKSVEDVLQMHLAAGRGLSAAHSRGLVHRDYKPTNVLVGRDGRARVADFGLVSATQEQVTGDDLAPTMDTLDITRAGSVVGTPRYMAPEQLAGRPASPASDQFSFCVTLYESLYRSRPFTGNTLMELRASIARGPTIPESTRSIRGLFAPIARGLSDDPAERYPSLDALLQALHRKARIRGGRGPLLFLGGAALASVAGVATWSPRSSECPIAGPEGLVESFRNTETALAHRAPRMASDVGRALDRYALAWSRTRAAACGGELRTPAERAVVLQCLEARRVEAEQAVDWLNTSERPAARRALLVHELSPPSTCLVAQQRSLYGQAPEQADLTSSHRVLAEIHYLYELGKLGEAMERLDDGTPTILATRSPSLRLRSMLLRSAILIESGDVDVGISLLEDVYADGLEYDLSALSHRAALRLMQVNVHILERVDEAETWSLRATALLEHATPLDRVHHQREMARLHLYRRRVDDALAAALEAERIAETIEGFSATQHASIQASVARAAATKGDYDLALTRWENALEIYTRLFGDDHPNIGAIRLGVAQAEFGLGNIVEARDLAETARLELLRHDGTTVDLMRVAVSEFSADIERREGNFHGALAHHHATLDMLEELDDPDLKLRSALRNMSITLERMGRHTEALRVRERVRVLSEAVDGPDSSQVGICHNNLGASKLALGATEDAAQHFRASIRILEATRGSETRISAYPLTGLAEILVGDGRAERARPLLLRALDLAERYHDDPQWAAAATVLARVLVEADPPELARALELADEAQQKLEGIPSHADELEALIRWRETL